MSKNVLGMLMQSTQLKSLNSQIVTLYNTSKAYVKAVNTKKNTSLE